MNVSDRLYLMSAPTKVAIILVATIIIAAVSGVVYWYTTRIPEVFPDVHTSVLEIHACEAYSATNIRTLYHFQSGVHDYQGCREELPMVEAHCGERYRNVLACLINDYVHDNSVRCVELHCP